MCRIILIISMATSKEYPSIVFHVRRFEREDQNSDRNPERRITIILITVWYGKQINPHTNNSVGEYVDTTNIQVEEEIDNDIANNTNRRFCASISRVVFPSMMGSNLVLFLFVDDVYYYTGPIWTKIYVTTLSENGAVMIFRTKIFNNTIILQFFGHSKDTKWLIPSGCIHFLFILVLYLLYIVFFTNFVCFISRSYCSWCWRHVLLLLLLTRSFIDSVLIVLHHDTSCCLDNRYFGHNSHLLHHYKKKKNKKKICVAVENLFYACCANIFYGV